MSEKIESIRINIALGQASTKSKAAAHPDRSKVFIPASIISTKGLPCIIVDYPVNDDFYFDMHSPQDTLVGVTVGELIDRVIEIYDEIYTTEEATSTIEPGVVPGMLNRNRTNGKYGVWGHVLSDLFFASADYDAAENRIDLGIDS